MVACWDSARFALLRQVYSLSCDPAVAVLNGESLRAARERFGAAADEIPGQRVITVRDLWAGTEVAMNPLRACRQVPHVPWSDVVAYYGEQHEICFLCRKATGASSEVWAPVFGEMAEDGLAVACASALASTPYAGLIATREHNITRMTVEEWVAAVRLGIRYLREAVRHAHGRAACAALVADVGGKAGQSVRHAHLQAVVALDRPFAWIERALLAASAYARRHGGVPGYFDDVFDGVRDVGLGDWLTPREGATPVFCQARLVPVKEREIELSTHGVPDEAFSRTLWHAWQWLMREGANSWNMVLVPNLASLVEDRADVDDNWMAFPGVVARIVDRGPIGGFSDWAAMELYLGRSVVAADPFEVADGLLSTIESAGWIREERFPGSLEQAAWCADQALWMRAHRDHLLGLGSSVRPDQAFSDWASAYAADYSVMGRRQIPSCFRRWSYPRQEWMPLHSRVVGEIMREKWLRSGGRECTLVEASTHWLAEMHRRFWARGERPLPAWLATP